jgi:hypothetical protein
MERPDFIAVALSSLFSAKLAFLGNLAGMDTFIILLIVLLLFSSKNLRGPSKGMDKDVGEMFKRNRLEREKYEPTEEERRVLRNCDLIAAILLVLIVAALAAAVVRRF